MPLQATSGAASYDAFGGGGAAVEPNYIESVFSTYLYTGNGSTQTITNGIDLAGEGGLVWIKNRSGTTDHYLTDTQRSANYGEPTRLVPRLETNNTDAQVVNTNMQNDSSYNSDGFTLADFNQVNGSGNTYVSWTLRKQEKFFDVVTWTGNGSTQTISHSLSAIPGVVIIKKTSATSNWYYMYDINVSNCKSLFLNTTDISSTSSYNSGNVFSARATSTQLFLGSEGDTNASGATFVAYLFAHNAGGFGLTGTDNVISCGSVSTTNSQQDVTIGYEPQYIMWKCADSEGSWWLWDTMRGLVVDGGTGTGDKPLYANVSDAEGATFGIDPTATGFQLSAGWGAGTYIYIAIRRGPMKVPTDGTSVFGLSARTGTGANATVTGSAGVSDAVLVKNRGSGVASLFSSRLTGTGYLVTSTTAAEVAAGTTILQAIPWDVMDGVKVGTSSTITNASANTFINYLFDRAPSFFDEVCYTGTGSATTQTHNLGVVPELMIVKRRSATDIWVVYDQNTGNTGFLRLNATNAVTTSAAAWNDTSPTDSDFTLGTYAAVNASGSTYVAYLFASAPGVSKVGSYTGTATTKQIDCGFTAGARFVLIKRTDSTGDWYVWDTARGIVAGNDSYLLLNSTAAEVTNTDYIDTYSAGFEISSTAPAAINASGGSFIFFAVA